jgi:hypothetical protein
MSPPARPPDRTESQRSPRYAAPSAGTPHKGPASQRWGWQPRRRSASSRSWVTAQARPRTQHRHRPLLLLLLLHRSPGPRSSSWCVAPELPTRSPPPSPHRPGRRPPSPPVRPSERPHPRPRHQQRRPVAATEHRGTVMACQLHIIVNQPDGRAPVDLDGAVDLLDHLEARWSRFLPDSDITRINDGAGTPVAVAPETVRLVETMRAAWDLTQGRYDPTILPILVANGYATSRVDAARSTVLPAGPFRVGATGPDHRGSSRIHGHDPDRCRARSRWHRQGPGRRHGSGAPARWRSRRSPGQHRWRPRVRGQRPGTRRLAREHRTRRPW